MIIINGVNVAGQGMDPQFAAYFTGPYCIAHIVAINLVYWLYVPTLNITAGTAFHWTWLSAYLAIMIAFSVPALFWVSIFIPDADWAHWTYYIFSMGSVGGPMLLFLVPLILALSNYVVGWKSGYLVDWN